MFISCLISSYSYVVVRIVASERDSMMNKLLAPLWQGSTSDAKMQKKKLHAHQPNPAWAIGLIIYRLHTAQPLQHHEVAHSYMEQLLDQAKLGCHVAQRTARILGTLLLRLCVPHPLGWTVTQEVVCMLMYGILQSRQVPAWRAFFSGVGEVQQWVPAVKEQVVTGSCSSWWVRLPPEERPKKPAVKVNWFYLHGGAFVAGDAMMYLGVFTYWCQHLAKQGVDCSVLSVEYPLAPEHPFPAGVNAAAGALHWLLHESGETAEYFIGGDSAGGNLALSALSLLREQEKLTRLPLALTLISPAVDMSNSSVFGSRELVTSHFDEAQPAHTAQDTNTVHNHNQEQQQFQEYSCSSSSSSSHHDLRQHQQREEAGSQPREQPQQQHSQQSQQQQQQSRQPKPEAEADAGEHCTMHARHTAGGGYGPWRLLRCLASEVATTCRVHCSGTSAAAQSASGWFDYIPSQAFADELHCYLTDPKLLTDPLVSPTYINDLTGLCQQGMLLVAGGAELMRPDIQAFAAKVRAAGVPVVYHEEPREPHAYPVVALPHLLRKGLVVTDYVADVALGRPVRGGSSGSGSNGSGSTAGGGSSNGVVDPAM